MKVRLDQVQIKPGPDEFGLDYTRITFSVIFWSSRWDGIFFKLMIKNWDAVRLSPLVVLRVGQNNSSSSRSRTNHATSAGSLTLHLPDHCRDVNTTARKVINDETDRQETGSDKLAT